MAAPNIARRNRAWAFTWNNPNNAAADLCLETIRCQYIVWQTEMGARNTKHVQGYIYFKNGVTMRAVKRKLSDSVHLEIARGSPEQNKEYCTKKDTRVEGTHGERGTMPTQGKRADMEDMMKDVLVLNNWKMMEKYPMGWARYQRCLINYRRDKQPARTVMTKVTVFWGPTGTGKSHRAHSEAFAMDEDYGVLIIQEKKRSLWVDGAEGCDVLVIDDFEGEIAFRALLQLIDRYKCNAPVKGSYCNWAPKHIFITSNVHPQNWYLDRKWHGGPLKRRLTTNGSTIVNLLTIFMPQVATVVEINSDNSDYIEVPEV